ncbi:MAG TPA: PQQ-binding-like beta-propeller repeat protein, partial [Pirellulales bacterium]|nr:PQQ-binding-like beta-propeller repeat protein [Pirellulales bacterium]
RGRAYVHGTQSVIVPVGEGQGAPVPLFGYTGSLLVTEGLVISSVGGSKAGTIMAFDAETGKEAWRALDDEVSYSSPVSALLAGREQVVVMTGPEVVGLELATGRKLWSWPFQIQYNESISTPAVADPYVVVNGDGRPLTALKITPRGDGCALAVAWENRDLSSYLSSAVITHGHVYGMNDGGEFGCVRLDDGKMAWLVGGTALWGNERAAYYCTPLLAGPRLLALDERGRLSILSATPKPPPPLSITRLTDREAWSSPALVGNMLYVRAREQLLAFALRDER